MSPAADVGESLQWFYGGHERAVQGGPGQDVPGHHRMCPPGEDVIDACGCPEQGTCGEVSESVVGECWAVPSHTALRMAGCGQGIPAYQFKVGP